MKKVVKITEYISKFERALANGLNSIVEASEAYVAAIDQDPQCVKMFHKKFEGVIPPGAWSGFEAVGRKCMHHNLLFGGGKNAPHIKRLPYSEQEKVFSGERFELLVKSGESILVDLREITTEQARQLVGDSHIRSLSEQRAYIESVKKDEQQPVMIDAPYKIKKGELIVERASIYTKDELVRILSRM